MIMIDSPLTSRSVVDEPVVPSGEGRRQPRRRLASCSGEAFCGRVLAKFLA